MEMPNTNEIRIDKWHHNYDKTFPPKLSKPIEQNELQYANNIVHMKNYADIAYD